MQKDYCELFEGLPQQKLIEIIRAQADIASLGPDLADVLERVTEHARTLTGADGAALELLEGPDMVYRAACGIAANQLGLRLKAASSLSGYCVQRDEAVNCTDVEKDARVDLAACRRIGLRSMMVFPLHHGDLAQGVLKVMSSRTSAFTTRDGLILELLSDLVGAAIYHAARMGEDELLRRATRDALTGLPNRAAFFDELQARLLRSSRDGSLFALLYMDLDGLKPTNDQYGHEAGDALLRAFGERLSAELRSGDMLARLGGDEFAILLANVVSGEEAGKALQRFRQTLDLPFHDDGLELPLAASFGMTLYPEDGGDVGGLVGAADAAMYAEKRARKARASQTSQEP